MQAMLEKLPESIGHALQGQRAGLEKILFNRLDLRSGVAKLALASLAFVDHGPIPAQYTADGEGVSPPLSWRGVPPATATLVLIVEDADSPTPEPLVHAIAVNIDPTRDGISEGELREAHTPPDASGATLHLGRNSYLRPTWLPPDPPPGHGKHRYAFQLFALTAGAAFSHAPGREEVATAVRERGIASGCLIGIYARDNRVKLDESERSADELPSGAMVAS
jgi:hypothetical protein